MDCKESVFDLDKALIGMVHVAALPGTPHGRLCVREIAERAAAEAVILAESGFDAIIIENMHDRPYLRRKVGPETVAAMARVGHAVRRAISIPMGVQILAGANREALAVAQSIEAQFIRAEGFVFAAVADEGLMDEADAGSLLRYQRQIGADSIKIFCDIKKKHSSHALTSDVTLAETAEAAEFFGADGVIVTGAATGRPTSRDDVSEVAGATTLPILVGSGVTPQSAGKLFEFASGLIVGSYCKVGGSWHAPLDQERIDQLINAVNAVRVGKSL